MKLKNKKNKQLLFLLVILWGINLNAQKSLHKKVYEVSINSIDGYTKVTVMAKKAKFKPNEKCTYYWYALNKIINTKGGFDGARLSGSYVEFYANDNLREKGTFTKA